MDEKPLDWKAVLDHVAVSDVGMRRGNNQDSYAVVLADDMAAWRRRGHVFLVADGMGAHAAGELASKMAADSIPHTYHKLRGPSPPDAIRRSVEEINAQIHFKGQANAEFHGMGTTTSVLVILPQGAMVAHVGDSRVYRLRGNRLEQLSFDHSLVWEMMAAKHLATSTTAIIPKNIITRSLGPKAHVQVDLEGPFPLAVGDTFLLCSDGLTGQVKDEELGAILASLPPREAAHVLVDLANLRGGPDNITVIVVRVASQALLDAAGPSPEPLLLRGPAGDHDRERRVHPGIWAVAGLLLVLGAALAIGTRVLPALACVVGAALTVALGVWQKLAPSMGAQVVGQGVALGRGPHVAIECPPDTAIADNLVLMVEQLRDAANDSRFDVNWDRFQDHRRRGLAALANKDARKAVQELGRAIHAMMAELRSQRASGGSLAIPRSICDLRPDLVER